MALGLILTIAALIGIVYGVVNKRKVLVITSAIVLSSIAALGLYIFKNPY